MKNRLKLIVIALAALVNSSLQAEVSVKAVIAAIKNNSAQNITLKSTAVKAGAEKTVLLEVPFVSYKQHRSEFVFGQPYAPEVALKIMFKDGRAFLVWRDERGFVGAFDRNPNIAYDDSVPATLLPIDTSKALIRLLLLIDAHGKVSLQQQS